MYNRGGNTQTVSNRPKLHVLPLIMIVAVVAEQLRKTYKGHRHMGWFGKHVETKVSTDFWHIFTGELVCRVRDQQTSLWLNQPWQKEDAEMNV